MTRARTTAALVAGLATVALAGCIADDPDASPGSTSSPPATTPGSTAVTDTTSPGTTPATTEPARPPRLGGAGRAGLTFFGDCPELLAYLQGEALARVSAWGLGGGPYYPGRRLAGAEDPVTTEAPAAFEASPDEGAATSADSFSTTNTQEVGVDEGDLVETNGTHVFAAGFDGVRIVDVAEARLVATLDVPPGSQQLLLDGTRLLVTTQPYTGVEDTIVSLYDVADPSAPRLVRRSHLEGRLVAARAIDGTARLVLMSSMATRLPFVYPEQFGFDEATALAENRRVISESDVDDWMPRAFDEAGDGSFEPMTASLDCATVAAPPNFAGLGISWIASVDMRAGSAPVGAAGVVSTGETVYASAANIYLATVPWDWYHPMSGTPDGGQPPTLIHQFALGAGGAATYEASGEVKGHLLNQFSMSELNGDLRVATTTFDWTGTGQQSSAVRVLRPDGNGALVEIGAVEGLGLTEQIYAVRFLGDQAYVVTFRQTDPLYVVDLRDPVAPVVAGELKIPGYSAYLHPVGDGLLLGVGQDANEGGGVRGTQLSLFDVRDPANPQRLSTLAVGGWSEAEWDHHAFLYWAEDGTIVIPVSPGWGDCGPAVDCLADSIAGSAGGVVVAQLEGETLVGRGTIAHEASEDRCWNPLQRSLVIGAEIVTVGPDQVQFTDRDTLTRRDAVRWGEAGEYGCAWYVE
jgi:hypothetical protein